MIAPTVVVDTNVFIGALVGREGHNRKLIRACLAGQIQPVMGQALFWEFESVMKRDDLFVRSPLIPREREELFQSFLNVCRWVQLYFSWRPNLADEGDNHVLELAVAAGASAIITNNISDFRRAELRFDGISIWPPAEFLKQIKREA